MRADPGRLPSADARCASARGDVKPIRRADSNATSSASPSSSAAQSINVRVAEVHGLASTTTRSCLGSASVRCTCTSRDRRCLSRGTVTCTSDTLHPSSRSNVAAVRCDTTASPPNHSVAAIAVCSGVVGAPGIRYTPGCTPTRRPALTRRSIWPAVRPAARACSREQTPYCSSAIPKSVAFMGTFPSYMQSDAPQREALGEERA